MFFDLFGKSEPTLYDYIHKAMEAEENSNFEEAIFNYSKCLELQPNNVDFYNSISYCYENMDKLENAIEYLTKSIELSTHHKTYSHRARVYSDLRQYKNAIDDYTKSIELFPDDIDNYFYRAHCYMESKCYEKAIYDYSKLIEQYPDDANLYIYRGECYIELKQFGKADADFLRADKLSGDSISEETYQQNADAIHTNPTQGRKLDL